MVGMIQIVILMLAFYFVIKGVEIVVIAASSERGHRGGIFSVAVGTLIVCILAALFFVTMQDRQAKSISGISSEPMPSFMTPSEPSPRIPFDATPETNPRANDPAVVDAHNRGYDWAGKNGVKTEEQCAQLSDADERVGCERYVSAMSK